MSLKKVLITLLIVSAILFAVFSRDILDSLQTVLKFVPTSPEFAWVIVLAIALQLAGHTLRALKTKLLLKPIKSSSVRFQFRALTIGYICNALLPLRLGELVRSYIMASADKISWGVTLSLVLIERSVDALLLLFIGVAMVSFWGSNTTVLLLLVLLGLFALLVVGGVYMLKSQHPLALKAIYTVSRIFNDEVRKSFRFRAWSVIYGLQKTVNRQSLQKYFLLTLGHWVLYIGSIAVVYSSFFPATNNLAEAARSSAAPYYGISLPAGPAGLGAYSHAAQSIADFPSLDGVYLVFLLVAWAVLVIPVSVIALAFLLFKTHEPLRRQLPLAISQQSLIDKLSRVENISAEMQVFLENYFSGNPLSRIVHRLEQTNEFHLLKYFKGGSDAITILASEKDGSVVVKKIISLEHKDRLKAQYDWLRRRESEGIVRAIGERTGDDYYSIDLAYDPANEMFFEYLHHADSSDAERVMDEVWSYLSKELYGQNKLKNVTDYDALDAYIKKHIFGCLEQSITVHADLKAATKPEKVIINGREYDNIHIIMEKIVNHTQARKDLATYSRSKEVDGDLALDNILVSRATGQVLIIDPAPDGNIINGPVFDFGKNMQSLYCGYEFLFRSNETVVLKEGNRIDYQDLRSKQYVELCEYVRTKLAPRYLSSGEQKSILFHAAALHIRRLKHQVYQNPAIALAMYAVGVRTLNEFFSQYKQK